MRIAMWSGPRNISTAMMYAFGNREDFSVWDEPFYAPYLNAAGLDHPLRERVIGSHETDPQKVSQACVGPIPDGCPHFYMKHMALHMIEAFPIDWAERCVNVHLIRHPARVVASYAAKREKPGLHDIGFQQQVSIFNRFPGPILDSDDIRTNPEASLRQLCDAIGLSFDPRMLSWSKGPKPFDGAWAPHWYNAVHQSTGFAGPEGPLPELDEELARLVALALPYYEALSTRSERIR